MWFLCDLYFYFFFGFVDFIVFYVTTSTFRNASNFTRSGSQNSNISVNRPVRPAPAPPRTSGSGGGVTDRVSSRRHVTTTSASRCVIYLRSVIFFFYFLIHIQHTNTASFPSSYFLSIH